MWSLRVLSGPQSGQILRLNMGRNTLGRSKNANVTIESNGVSKVHAELIVDQTQIVVNDLNSSNGTFINGTRVQTTTLQLGDKIAFHNVICDVVAVPDKKLPTTSEMNVQNYIQQQPFGVPQQQPAYGMEIPSQAQAPDPVAQAQPAQTPPQKPRSSGLAGVFEAITEYIDNTVLPGVYALPERVDYRYVVMGFLALLIIITSALSVVPMIQITRSSVEKEAMRRALSLARSLASQNEQALAQGIESALSTNSIKIEDGVIEALIVRQSDGSIVAPAKRAGEFPDLPFVTEARTKVAETVNKYELSKIGASVPLSFYNPDIASYSIKYHAIVLYDSDVLAIDSEQTTALFLQTLIISLVFGALIGFFLLKLIDRPYQVLNKQIDEALRTGSDTLAVNVRLPALQRFATNLSSVLTRAIYGGQDNNSGGNRNVFSEAENLVSIMALPAIAYHIEGYIITVNASFETLLNKSTMDLQNQSLQAIPDQALQLSLSDLIDRSTVNPNSVNSNELDFSGESFLINCQAVQDDSGQPVYFVVSFSGIFDEGGFD
jgi:hypothetical protein